MKRRKNRCSLAYIFLFALFFSHQSIAYGDFCEDFKKNCAGKEQEVQFCVVNDLNIKSKIKSEYDPEVDERNKSYYASCHRSAIKYVNYVDLPKSVIFVSEAEAEMKKEKKKWDLSKILRDSLKAAADKCYKIKHLNLAGLYDAPYPLKVGLGDLSSLRKYSCIFKRLSVRVTFGGYHNLCQKFMQADNLARNLFHNKSGAISLNEKLIINPRNFDLKYKPSEAQKVKIYEDDHMVQFTSDSEAHERMAKECKISLKYSIDSAIKKTQKAKRGEASFCVNDDFNKALNRVVALERTLDNEYSKWDDEQILESLYNLQHQDYKVSSCFEDFHKLHNPPPPAKPRSPGIIDSSKATTD